jgi:uncharacterized membrane protein YdcZ (DUF606 family)
MPTLHAACIVARTRRMQPCNLQCSLAPAWQYFAGPVCIASNITTEACIVGRIAPGRSITAWISAGGPESFQEPLDPSPAGEH